MRRQRRASMVVVAPSVAASVIWDGERERCLSGAALGCLNSRLGSSKPASPQQQQQQQQQHHSSPAVVGHTQQQQPRHDIHTNIYPHNPIQILIDLSFASHVWGSSGRNAHAQTLFSLLLALGACSCLDLLLGLAVPPVVAPAPHHLKRLRLRATLRSETLAYLMCVWQDRCQAHIRKTTIGCRIRLTPSTLPPPPP
jgi:hypothetical protein